MSTHHATTDDISLALVRCASVAHTYGTGANAVVAVHETWCTVHAGERVAISGPSGSGKSTLLHLMAGLEEPTAGSVRWPDPGCQPGLPAGIALVFQAPSLLPFLDVAENVALPLILAGHDADHAATVAAEALAELGLGDLRSKLPDQLSGGQAQRVAVARALAARPRLLLADEPTGQLDHDTSQQVVTALVRAADTAGAALVVATHDPRVAERLTERWTMTDGRLHAAPPAPGAGRPRRQDLVTG